MMVHFAEFSLWFSPPLSIWLSTGWVGLISCWQAISKWPARWTMYPSKRTRVFEIRHLLTGHSMPTRNQVESKWDDGSV